MTEAAAKAAILKTRPHMPVTNLSSLSFAAGRCSHCGVMFTHDTGHRLPIRLPPLSFRSFPISRIKVVYISLFCITVSRESNLPVPFIRTSELQAFISRGFIYSFLGLICVEKHIQSRSGYCFSWRTQDEFHVGWLAIFMQISSWFMLGVGAFLHAPGVFCLKAFAIERSERSKKNGKVSKI
jgi:hypothetical protein